MDSNKHQEISYLQKDGKPRSAEATEGLEVEFSKPPMKTPTDWDKEVLKILEPYKLFGTIEEENFSPWIQIDNEYQYREVVKKISKAIEEALKTRDKRLIEKITKMFKEAEEREDRVLVSDVIEVIQSK